jgi:2-polyprenyl-3-methyl-5-hydroxy-6-metoxy-1,4-benzoquinol methylase
VTAAALRFRLGTARRRLLGWKPYPDSVSPACALCGSEDRLTVGRRVAFDMRYRNVVCRSCGLAYLCPRPDEEGFSDFYERLYPVLYGKRRQDEVGSDRGAAVAAFLEQSLDISEHAGVFDVGCGGGGLLRAVAHAQRLGSLRLAGCDPGWHGEERQVLHEGAARIDMFRAGVEELADVLGSYSIFVLYDVIEHLLAPQEFLTTLHATTSPGSVLFVSTNALDNWADIPAGGWERYYLRLAHTYTFTKRTLAALLRGHGWRPIASTDAPKGDQWVLAERADPDPAALRPAPEHYRDVLGMIEAYRRRPERPAKS